jgi:YVTN family beta-propeller protein
MDSGSATIFLRDGSAGEAWRVTSVRAGAGAEGFDVSPDGKQLWVANGGDGTVSIIDIASARNIATLNVNTARSNRLKFTPDGKRVLISDFGSGELVVLDVASRKVTKRIHVGAGLAGLLVDADGSHAYAAATNDNFVAIVDLAKLEITGRIATGIAPDGMDWLPVRTAGK